MSKEFLHQELEVAQAGGSVKEGTRKSRVGGIFTTVFFSFSILLSIAAVTFAIVFVIHAVLGTSMMLALNPHYNFVLKIDDPSQSQDIVLTNRFVSPKLSNVITVRHYWGPDTNPGRRGEAPGLFIKRVIGLENDRIRFERECIICIDVCTHSWSTPIKGVIWPNEDTPFRYRLVRNDKIIEEHYSGYDLPLHRTDRCVMAFYGDQIYEYLENGTRPHGANLFFGDYVPFRAASVVRNEDPESPSFGKYEIHVKKGEIFYMGDNRGGVNTHADFLGSHSYDGTAFGPQPLNLVTGVRIATIKNEQSIPSFIWQQITSFFSFKWLR